MQVIEKNSLFAQVSGEQSAVVSGGQNSAAGELVLAVFLIDGVLSITEVFNTLFVSRLFPDTTL